jgi:uncharacterized protein (TIGR03435 family)
MIWSEILQNLDGVMFAVARSSLTLLRAGSFGRGKSTFVATVLFANFLYPFCSQAQAQSPTFDVASIRVSNSGDSSSYWHDQRSRMMATNVSLQKLITFAYEVHDFQISGPGWLRSQRFDIQAEAAEWAEKGKRPIIMQNLLTERFNLAVHRTTKNLTVYALIDTSQGPNLSPVDAGGTSGVTSNRGHLTLKKASMKELVDSLSRIVDRPVIDKTGLTGAFNGELRWMPDNEQADSTQSSVTASDDGPSLFTAIKEQFGLKLIPQRASVEMLVIDRVEKLPTEN